MLTVPEETQTRSRLPVEKQAFDNPAEVFKKPAKGQLRKSLADRDLQKHGPNTEQREVHLPEGEWIHFWSGQTIPQLRAGIGRTPW